LISVQALLSAAAKITVIDTIKRLSERRKRSADWP